jgi:beta-glucosidase
MAKRFIPLLFITLFLAPSGSNAKARTLFSKAFHALVPHKEKRIKWDKNTRFQQLKHSPKQMAAALSKLEFIGATHSDLQYHGISTNHGTQATTQWTPWLNTRIAQGKAPANSHITTSSQGWKHFKDDIAWAAEHGMNMLRFSIEWSKVEPVQGVYDDETLREYAQWLDCCLEHGIMPMITFFHHSWPVWFQTLPNKKPHFEDRTNIHHFVNYCVYSFNKLREFVKPEHKEKLMYWLTFNEPAGYALAAYVDGKYPPGHKFEIKLAGTVTKNMLDAHIAVYDRLKQIDKRVQISLAHAVNPIAPYHPWNPIERLAATTFDAMLNDATIDYFRTGKFKWIGLKEFNQRAIGKLDFIGITYYSHTLIKQSLNLKLGTGARPEEIVTRGDAESPKGARTIYAEGLYDAIKRVSVLKKPIFITENGCATDDIAARDEYVKRHLYVVAQALAEGYDIRSYLWWTLVDGYSWGRGNASKHGILQANFDHPECPRMERPGIQFLLNVYQALTPLNK